MRKLFTLLIVGLLSIGMFSQANATTCAGAALVPGTPTFPWVSTLTCGAANDITAANATVCGNGSYLGGLEAVYAWTPDGSYIDVSFAYTGVSWTGIFLYQGCPTSGGICIGNVTGSGTAKTLAYIGTNLTSGTKISVTAGLTYYIVIDTWPSPASPCPGTITINGTLNLACSGTPNPGNTISTSNPVCPGVNFTLSLQTPTSGSGVTYSWETSPDGLDPWTPAGATNATYTTAQTVAKYYRCQVTCAGNTGISTPVYVTINTNFVSCYCTAIPTSTADEEIYSVTLNGATNAYNCTTVAPGPGSILNRYSNFYPLGSLTDLSRTTTVGFTILEDECDGATYYGNGCAIWIDFNQNGSFADAGEQVYVEASTTISPRTITGLITIPVGAVLGQTAMRIIVAEGKSGTLLVPCLVYDYGETEDYLVNITAAPACPPPSALLATTTAHTADLSWTENGTATLWDIEWGSTPFTPTGTPTTSGLTAANTILTGLTASTGYAYYVRADCGGGAQSTWTGPHVFTTTVSCPAPTTPVSSAITTTTATIDWTVTGLETAWDIEYGPAGFVAGSGVGYTEILGTSTKPYGLTSLLPGQLYDFYVRASCGVGDVSLWTPKASFTTACVPLTTLPWVEGFESMTTVGSKILPACWSYENVVGTSGPYSANTSGTYYGPNGGTRFLYTYYANTTWVFTPQMHLLQGVSYDFSFYMMNKVPTSPIDFLMDVAYGASNNSAGMTNVLATGIVCSNATYTKFSYTIIPAADGDFYFGVKTTSATSTPWYISLDDFSLDLTPACAGPTALTATDITETQAFLGWTEMSGATMWDLEWGLSGFAFGTGTRVTGIAGNPHKLTGLTASTTYQFYVRSYCPLGGYSAFSGPQAFTTSGIPNCAVIGSPLNAAVNVLPTATLNWTSGGGAPTGYKLYFGKSSPPTYIGDLGNVLTYNPAPDMDWSTQYFWKVVPYSGSGDAVGCSEWSFTTSAPSYCAASATCDEYISSVQVGTIDNATACTSGGYANYTAISTTMSEGGSYPITVTNGLPYSGDQCGIWVDWNGDYDFDDAGESSTVTGTGGSGPYTAVLIPPVGAAASTRMRVRITYTGTLSPCGSASYGETEDYTITIAPPPDHDAGTLSIDNVPASALPGTVIVPKATVKNFGLNTETFDVTLTATGGYTSTVNVAGLAPGASTQVTFSNWTTSLGTFTLQACTQLVGDMNAANNCKSSSVLVSNSIWSAGSAIPGSTYMGTGVGYTDNSVSPPVGYLFSFGGNTASTLGTECYKYNETTATWTTIAPLPAKRIVSTSAVVGTYIYVIGGSDGVAAYVNTVYRYDILTDTWTTLPSTLPKTIGWGKAVAYGSNYIYLAGGVDAYTGGVVIPDVYLYDIALDTWTVATAMPGPKFGGAFSRTGDKLVYVAGADLTVISNTVYVGTISSGAPGTITWATAKSPYPGTLSQPVESTLDPASTTIVEEKIPFNANRVNYPGGAMYRFDGAPWGTDGIIVAAGSPSAAWTPAVPNPCYYYNPTTDVWTAKPDVPTAVLGASTGSVDLNNAGVHTWKLILASGYTGTVASTATQILTEIMSVAPPVPLSVTGVATNALCAYDCNGSIDITVTGGTTPYSYLWSNLATTEDVSGLCPGAYSVTVTDATTTTTGSWTVTAPSDLSWMASTTNVTCNGSNNGTITTVSTMGGTPPYTYNWSNGATTSNLTGLTAGTYAVTVADVNLCDVRSFVTIQQPDAIGLSAITNAAACPTSNDGSIDLTVSGGVMTYSYIWSNSATTEDISGLAPGDYSVTVTDGNACTIGGTFTVGQASAVCPNITVTGTVSTVVCYNASNTITVAGTPETFTVSAPGGNATFIAGVKILFEPGTHVEFGAYMHGYISTTYCSGSKSLEGPVAEIKPEETQMNLSHAYFNLYPNPTSGNFTLEQKGEKTYGTVKVEIYSMNGKKVMTENIVGEKKHEFNFSDLPVGLYFVKIVADEYVETIKLIKSR